MSRHMRCTNNAASAASPLGREARPFAPSRSPLGLTLSSALWLFGVENLTHLASKRLGGEWFL
jgi:hypothetical protein